MITSPTTSRLDEIEAHLIEASALLEQEAGERPRLAGTLRRAKADVGYAVLKVFGVRKLEGDVRRKPALQKRLFADQVA